MTSAHSRFDVDVGARDSNSAGVQTRSAVQTVSDVFVAGATWYCSAEHPVMGLHTRSEVAVGAAAWYSETKHVRSA